MIRTTIFATIVGVLAVAGSARAEEGQGAARFGSRGFIVSAERLIPLTSYEAVKTTQSDGLLHRTPPVCLATPPEKSPSDIRARARC